MESPLIEGHWYKITRLDENNIYRRGHLISQTVNHSYYIGKLIESSIQFNMAYFEGVVQKNGKKGSYTEIGEQNFVMGSYAYTEPTEGEALYAKSLFNSHPPEPDGFF